MRFADFLFSRTALQVRQGKPKQPSEKRVPIFFAARCDGSHRRKEATEQIEIIDKYWNFSKNHTGTLKCLLGGGRSVAAHFLDHGGQALDIRDINRIAGANDDLLFGQIT